MLQADLGNIGEVLNASIGNLTTSLTLIAHNDIVLDNVKMSSADAPYVTPPPQPPSMITMTPRSRRKSKRDAMNTSDLEATDAQPLPSEQLNEIPSETIRTQELPDKPIADTPVPVAPDAVEAKPTAESSSRPASVVPPPTPVSPVATPEPSSTPPSSEANPG